MRCSSGIYAWPLGLEAKQWSDAFGGRSALDTDGPLGWLLGLRCSGCGKRDLVGDGARNIRPTLHSCGREHELLRALESDVENLRQATADYRHASAARWLIGKIGDILAGVRGSENDINSAALRMSSQFHCYSSRRARLELDYTTRSADEAIAAAYEWFQTDTYLSQSRDSKKS